MSGRPHRARTAAAAVGIVAALFAGSFAAGASGVFSSAEQRLNQELTDPATSLSAAASLAQQFADTIGSEHPTVPGSRDQLTCPAAHLVRASTLIVSLSAADATAALQLATRRMGDLGWRSVASVAGAVEVDSSGTGVSRSVSARTRRSIVYTVSEEPGGQLSVLEVTVLVPCPDDRSATPATTAP